MTRITVRDIEAADAYFVGTCSHVNESDEIDACGQRRLAWLMSQQEVGLRVKVAALDGERAGFLHVMPIEISPWGPLGRDLMVIPCLFVLPKYTGRQVGSALLRAAKKEARWQRKKGLATIAYAHDFWFMPAAYFECHGFSRARQRGKETIMWQVYEQPAGTPDFLNSRYAFEALPGKVAIDLFWNSFCLTSNGEAQRVREVAAEFGDAVVLREKSADDPLTLLDCQLPRGIFVNGQKIGWGYEAPREGIREAIKQALTAT